MSRVCGAYVAAKISERGIRMVIEVCGYSNDDTFHGSKCNFKFCPNCGAKVVDK